METEMCYMISQSLTLNEYILNPQIHHTTNKLLSYKKTFLTKRMLVAIAPYCFPLYVTITRVMKFFNNIVVNDEKHLSEI